MRLVLCAEGPCEPTAGLLAYLSAWPASPADPVHVVFGMRRTPPPVAPCPQDGLTFGSLMPGRGLKDVQGVVYHRLSYSEVCQHIRSGALDFDAVVACATALTHSGQRSLGMVNGYLQLALNVTRRIVVEEVGWLPSAPGAAFFRNCDLVVQSPISPTDMGPPLAKDFDVVDESIAERVIRHLSGEIALSLGIGRIPSAVAHCLRGREDIRIVGGAVTDTIRELFETFPKSSRRPIMAMSVVGSPDLLEWAQDESRVVLLPSTDVHDPGWLSRIPNLRIILGALSIDGRGNVNSEYSRGKLVSGIGGAPDLSQAAHLAPSGRCIVAFRAGSDGSRIQNDILRRPTVPAQYVDFIATEHATADIRGYPASGEPLPLAELSGRAA